MKQIFISILLFASCLIGYSQKTKYSVREQSKDDGRFYAVIIIPELYDHDQLKKIAYDLKVKNLLVKGNAFFNFRFENDKDGTMYRASVNYYNMDLFDKDAQENEKDKDGNWVEIWVKEK